MELEYVELNENMYEKYYDHSGESSLVQKIWQDAFGDNYPQGIDHFGFLTNRDIAMFVDCLSDSNKGDVLLDIGCGKGGPGLKIAEEKQLKLIGIDIVEEAINKAELFKYNFELDHEADFRLGGFCNIPLEEKSVDNVISIDAFWMVKDREKALTEIKRIMKKNAKFIFTTWDSILFDQTPILEKNGFEVLYRNETENWKDYQTKVYKDILKYKNQLIKEMGESAQILISEATSAPLMLDVTQRRFYHTKLH
ncbi:class I SAM-dependent methyltransferase [Aquimarina sp. M1]